jgi:hypothetical protein
MIAWIILHGRSFNFLRLNLYFELFEVEVKIKKSIFSFTTSEGPIIHFRQYFAFIH